MHFFNVSIIFLELPEANCRQSSVPNLFLIPPPPLPIFLLSCATSPWAVAQLEQENGEGRGRKGNFPARLCNQQIQSNKKNAQNSTLFLEFQKAFCNTKFNAFFNVSIIFLELPEANCRQSSVPNLFLIPPPPLPIFLLSCATSPWAVAQLEQENGEGRGRRGNFPARLCNQQIQ